MPAKKPYRKTDRWANEKEFAASVGSGLNDVIGRGTLAGLLGAPGDIAGLAENGYRALMGMPQVQPWGGSEHIGSKLEKAGLVSPERRPKTELLASLISPAQLATAAYKTPAYAKTALKLMDNLEYAPIKKAGWPASQRGAIDVWHASPHKFDTFKAMDNIGAGEGAQAYGHGGYHASAPEVANSYKQALSPEYRSVISYAGPDRERQAASLLGSNIPEKDVLDLLADLGDESPALTLERGRKILAQAEESGNLYRNQLRWPDPAREAADPLSDKHFLDWDKPLSEQSEFVRRALGGLHGEVKPRVFAPTNIGLEPRGAQAHQALQDYFAAGRGNDAFSNNASFGSMEASNELRDLGIPGIRYLDGGSRSAGQGSYNYVTFDDALVNILERNGVPIAAKQPGLLGKMVAPQDEALRVAQQSEPSIYRDGRDGLFGGNVDYVARERFNIPALKKISFGGSDRDVYDLGDGHVLKVAKSARGLAQNDASDYYLSNAGILPEAVETGQNYIVTKKAFQPNAETKKLVNGLKQFNHQDWRNKSDRLLQYLEDNDLSDILSYDVMHGDIAAIRNWGTTADGKPIHLDEGTFNAGILDEFRGKTNMQNPEFRQVHSRSKMAKKKYGDKDKATMYGLGLLAPLLYNQQNDK